MKRIFATIVLLSTLLAVCLSPRSTWANPSAGDVVISHEGSAQDPKTGALLYRETHRATMRGQAPRSSETLYLGPSGEKWAVLKTQFTTPSDRFSHRFEDFRTGESHGVDLRRDGTPIMFNRDTGKDDFTRKPYRADADDPIAVAGQGFHWLIREQILNRKLKKSDTLTFRLLIPGRFDYFSFKLKIKNERAGKVYLTVKLASLFLRVVAGAEMALAYERKTGRLLEYLGPTNLRDQRGQAIEQVKIVYTYER
jgi:hypothetical protein